MIPQNIRDDLKERFGHRFPEVATVHISAEDGSTVDLQAVIANPIGSCADGPTPPGPWATMLRAALGLAEEDENLANHLAAECVVWQAGPDGEAPWRALVERWPGIPKTIANELRSKIGMRASIVPGPDGVVITVRGREIVAKVKRPDSGSWRLTASSLRRRDADHWRIVRDLAASCVLEVPVNGSVDDWGRVAARYPGIVALLFGHLARLVGAAAEVELGEL